MKYIIFGAGDTGRLALDIFGRENVKFFIDNNEKKQSERFEGLCVYSLEKALMLKGDAQIVIAVIPNYEKEIKEQLKIAGVNDFITANSYIYEERRRKLSERKDYISVYYKAIKWIKDHSIESGGIAVSSSENVIYPEVTGYYIPTLLRWGYRNLACEFAKGLLKIQRNDGAWNGPHDDTPYVFDTAQVLKGLISIRSILPEVTNAIVHAADWILSNIQPSGRLTTPDMEEWGKDNNTCSELIHLYCLSPLSKVSDITGNENYRTAAEKILGYYLTNSEERIIFHIFKHI